jgi:protein TonB
VSRRLIVWLLISLAIHAGLAGATVAALRGAMPPLLFVDLVHGVLVPEPAASGRDGDGGGSPPAKPAASPLPRSRVARGEPRHDTPPPRRPRPAPRETPAETPLLLSPPAPPSAAAVPPSTETTTAPVPPPTVVAPPVASSPTVESGVPHAVAPQIETRRGDADGASTAAPPAGESGPSEGQRSAGGGAAPPGHDSASEGTTGPGPAGRDGTALALSIPGGGGKGDAAEYAGALLRRLVSESLTYPSAAIRRSLTGTVQLELEIKPSGVISRVEVATSSSHRVLDEAAVDTVRRVGRVPFPPNFLPQPVRVRLPVVFELR